MVSAGSDSSISSTGADSAPRLKTTKAITTPGILRTRRTQRLPIVGVIRKVPREESAGVPLSRDVSESLTPISWASCCDCAACFEALCFFARRRLPATPGMRPAKALSPNRPSKAGIKVSATITAMATVAAAARPIAVRKPILATTSANNAIKTVAPAKTTDEPAVPAAIPAASGPSFVARSER